MDWWYIFLAVGFLSGLGFVELTYRSAGKGHLLVYISSLPLKLLFFALLFYACHALKGYVGLLLCLGGFLPGFLLWVFLRGVFKNGRVEGA